jgi:hypothetical protein
MVKSRLLFVEILLVLGLFPFRTVHFTRISDRHYLIDRPGGASDYICFSRVEMDLEGLVPMLVRCVTALHVCRIVDMIFLFGDIWI